MSKITTLEEFFKIPKKERTVDHLRQLDNALVDIPSLGYFVKYLEWNDTMLLEMCSLCPQVLSFLDNQTPELCLAAVQRNGYALRDVKEQTPEICTAAVQQDGWALRFVKEQTPEICLAAVQQSGGALEYVKEQTEEICLAAVQHDWRTICIAEHQTIDVCLVAAKNNPLATQMIHNEDMKVQVQLLMM